MLDKLFITLCGVARLDLGLIFLWHCTGLGAWFSALSDHGQISVYYL